MTGDARSLAPGKSSSRG